MVKNPSQAVSPSYTLEGRCCCDLRQTGDRLFVQLTPMPAVDWKQYGELLCPTGFEELKATDLILQVGSFNESQIAAIKVKEAAKQGAKLVVLVPKMT